MGSVIHLWRGADGWCCFLQALRMEPRVVFSKSLGHKLSLGRWEQLFAVGAVVTVQQYRNGNSQVPHYMTLQWRPEVGAILMDPLLVSHRWFAPEQTVGCFAAVPWCVGLAASHGSSHRWVVWNKSCPAVDAANSACCWLLLAGCTCGVA